MRGKHCGNFQAKKHTNGGPIDKSVGTLLYHIATKLKGQISHCRDLLVEYVSTKKLASENQLNGESPSGQGDVLRAEGITFCDLHIQSR